MGPGGVSLLPARVAFSEIQVRCWDEASIGGMLVDSAVSWFEATKKLVVWDVRGGHSLGKNRGADIRGSYPLVSSAAVTCAATTIAIQLLL